MGNAKPGRKARGGGDVGERVGGGRQGRQAEGRPLQIGHGDRDHDRGQEQEEGATSYSHVLILNRGHSSQDNAPRRDREMVENPALDNARGPTNCGKMLTPARRFHSSSTMPGHNDASTKKIRPMGSIRDNDSAG